MYDLTKSPVVFLGRAGENLARTVEIDVHGMTDAWPGAEIVLMAKRPGDSAPHPVVVDVAD